MFILVFFLHKEMKKNNDEDNDLENVFTKKLLGPQVNNNYKPSKGVATIVIDQLLAAFLALVRPVVSRPDRDNLCPY